MAERSQISWTRSTFNPWIGCTKVGPGCDHCYAEALDKRMRFGKAVHWGSGVPRYRTSARNWKAPLDWNARAAEERASDLTAPFAGRPGFWPVFCASLADVFDNEVPEEWFWELSVLINQTPNLSWLLVTKRIGRAADAVPDIWMERGFPENVRLLITVCDQEEADRDIPKLLALPCKNGISYEPALGPVDWRRWLPDSGLRSRTDSSWKQARALQWIIVGGESTQGAGKARPFVHGWARDTIRQCRAAGVPVFVKQMGSNAVNREGVVHPYKDRAGADPAEWPEDLRVQEFPE